MDYIDILQEMLRYIDANIKEKLSVEKLAARAGFSSYHFCRVFQWGTGFSIMEYVRNRKLEHAASELNSGFRIVDIAVEYGFETHSGFSKAFRRYFGSTPELYRIHALPNVPKLPILKKLKQYVNGGIVMEPKMVKKEAVKIAGFAVKTTNKGGENNKAIPKFWQEYLSDGRCGKLHGESFVKDHAEYGACFLINPGTGEFEYVIGVEIKEGADIPKEYDIRTIPEALYAVFSVPPANDANVTPAIQGTWNYIYKEWFPNSGYEFDEGKTDYELYKEMGKVVEIFIPVVKKSA